MKTSKKLLATLVVVGLAGSLVASAVFSAFSASTSNANNEFNAGSVNISDNDSGTALYNVDNAGPGDSETNCIRVTYTGSLDANVRLYTPSFQDILDANGAEYIDLTITPGTTSGPGCTGWAAGGAPVFTGTLDEFATDHQDFATGIALNDPLNADVEWVTNDAVSYQFEVSVQDVPAAQGAQSGVHSYTWESQNV